jgi:ATP-binding cassette subfamily C (CFTR/MRP) protein 1
MKLSIPFQVLVSLNRINRFLSASELDPASTAQTTKKEGNAIEVDNGSFTWTSKSAPTLSEVDLTVGKGKLVGVVGAVGAGKSSLLSAILGETEVVSGQVAISGSVAYVPQQAWIQNMTLQNNVLFDKTMEEATYNRVLDACALRADLAILTDGDQTEIGENGINLSGGQKQRVSLARAVYQDADIYLFDDPLSAVDAHVGKHLFENVISSQTGMLKDKTRVLVTHSISYLDKLDQIVVIRDGRIAERGTYSELKSSEGAFAEFLSQYGNEVKEKKHKKEHKVRTLSGVSAESAPLIESQRYRTLSGSSIEAVLEELKEVIKETEDSSSAASEMSSEAFLEEQKKQKMLLENKGALVEEEKALVGRVKWSVFLSYLKSIGFPICLFVLIMYAIGQGLHAVNNVWLSKWADANDADPDNADENTVKYLSVFAAIGASEAITEYSRELLLFLSCAKASKVVHERLLHSVFRSPMAWFDTVPNGRYVVIVACQGTSFTLHSFLGSSIALVEMWTQWIKRSRSRSQTLCGASVRSSLSSPSSRWPLPCSSRSSCPSSSSTSSSRSTTSRHLAN